MSDSEITLEKEGNVAGLWAYLYSSFQVFNFSIFYFHGVLSWFTC